MDKKKKDYLSYTLICQFLVCFLLFGAFWGLERVNSDIFVSIKNDYYSKLGTNFSVINNINITETENPPENESVEDATVSLINKAEENNNETASSNLTVEIKGECGQDYSVDSIDDVPDNVSVNSYVLNQKMILPVEGEITSPFGVRNHPINNELKFHAGVDIAADTGTPIYSAFPGKIIAAEYDEWNGYYIKIQHDGNIMTVYCHCSKLAVNEADFVEAGDIIGYVGATGSSTGPHLHFEFRVNNISYDPQTALEEAISAI